MPEFYSWFAAFLAAEPGTPPPMAGHGRRGQRGQRHQSEARAWSAEDADQAAWLHRKLAPPHASCSICWPMRPGSASAARRSPSASNSTRAHTASPGSSPGRAATPAPRPRAADHRPRARQDGGTDYYMEPGVAALFAATPGAGGGQANRPPTPRPRQTAISAALPPTSWRPRDEASVKRRPSGGAVELIEPPNRSVTIRRAVSRPRAVPSPTSLVVKNGSNTRSRIASEIPGPSSMMSTRTSRRRAPSDLDRSGAAERLDRVRDQVRLT